MMYPPVIEESYELAWLKAERDLMIWEWEHPEYWDNKKQEQEAESERYIMALLLVDTSFLYLLQGFY